MPMTLTAMEARVLGCLMEKAATTPEYYPLTLAALTAACNQKSNRYPVLQADEKEVVRALDGLREKKLASAIALAGSRAPKYRHAAAELGPLDVRQSAVLCELLLRGPQTVGELRTRAGRMAPFADAPDVQGALDALMAWPDGALAGRMPPGAGQREDRYAHLLCGPLPEEPARPPAEEPARLAVAAEDARLAALESRVAELGAELAGLKARLESFVSQFQ
jgi:uncharacterized protein YceH (UPF0502 family)